jgi:hypothetical protein
MRRAVVAIVLALCGCAALSLSVAGVAQAGGGAQGVGVKAAVSGSTLSVYLTGTPKSNCALSLGSGENAKRLPKARIEANGHGRLRWDIASDTPTGRQAVRATCGHAGVKRSGRAYVSISQAAVSGVLATVLNIILDVLLGGSLALFFWLLIDMILREPSKGERFMRSLALICGAIVALGAQASGVGFASFIVEALTGTRPGGGIVKFLSIVIPGGLAAAFGWYFTQVMRRSAMMGMRLVSFLGMLTVISFAVIFAEATETQGVFLGAAAIPNASFVVGLIFSVIVFTPAADDMDGASAWGIGDFIERIRRGTPSDGGEERPGTRTRRSPFADD